MFWNQWWTGDMFNTCMYRLANGDSVLLTAKHTCSVCDSICSKAEQSWLNDVRRVESRTGHGRNKLRTYARFKSEFELEPYLMCIHDERKRLLLFKLRTGIAPLRIETGRYESAVDYITGIPKKGLFEVNRICQCCFGGVEDEEHFLLVCHIYQRMRYELLRVFYAYCQRKSCNIPLDTYQLFNAIMSCKDDIVINALAQYVWDAFNHRQGYLNL